MKVGSSQRRDPETSTFPLGEGGHREGMDCEPSTESAGNLITGFSGFRTLSNKFLLLINHPDYDTLVVGAKID
jgi:hypothetical protein